MNDFYVIPNNKDVIFNNLILPLKDYSIGFDVYYTYLGGRKACHDRHLI